MADSIVARWFTPAPAQTEPHLVARALRMINGAADEGYAGCCEALVQWKARPYLNSITAPALIIAGERNPATPPLMMSILTDGIPGSRMEIFSPAAHIASTSLRCSATR